MKYLRYSHELMTPLLAVAWTATRASLRYGIDFLRRARLLSPGSRQILTWLLIAVGLVLQMGLVWLVGELVSLCIDVMALWAELAVKHLEITS
jgi:hypothetical protein